MKIVIFNSPQRNIELARLLNELKGLDVSVINDPETFGKDKFWMRFEKARQLCLESDHDNYAILHDDISNIDWNQVNRLFKKFKNREFVCALKTDDRTACWGSKINRHNSFISDGYNHVDIGFFDCCGITNRKTFGRFSIDEVNKSWFDRPNKSSGVGFQITMKLRRQKIPMYVTYPSLASHGFVDSVMHYEERKKTPLIAQTK
jgi:hypothetical protein